MGTSFVLAIIAAQTRPISPSVVIAIVGGLAIVIIVAILISRKMEQARTEALRQACGVIGFAFQEEGDVDQMRALGDLRLFDRGRGKRVKNVMSGRNPSGEVRIFDYLYTTGGGKSSTTWSQTVAFFPVAGRDLPEFMLSPENPIAHAMEKLAGYKDIDFDENPVFSSRYLLRGSDETAIRSAFTADMRTFMEQEPGWTVEVGGGNVAIYHPQQRVKPENIAAFLEKTSAVLRGLVAARRP